MSFPGSVRRILPRDFLPFSRILSVCFEYPFKEDKSADAFFEQVSTDAATAKQRDAVHFMDKYVAEYNGEVIAGICAPTYTINFDGNDMRMCGIGGVSTLPPYRRLGAVRALMHSMLRDQYESGVEWSLLYPFSQSYYEKFGYALSEPDMTWSVSTRHIRPFTDSTYTFSMYDGGGDISGFQEAYGRMANYNMMVIREACDYSKVTAADPFATNHFAYLCRDAKGAARGYAVWHKEREGEQSVMQIEELVFDSARSLHAILGFVSGFASDYGRVCFNAPHHMNLEAFFTDAVAGHLKRTSALCGMMRVIHVENALRGAKLLETGETALLVDDAILDKQYHIGLRWQDGQLTDFGPTNLTPDARLSVGAFSALLLGRFDSTDFPYVSGAEFIRPEKLTGLFYKKLIHTKNYF